MRSRFTWTMMAAVALSAACAASTVRHEAREAREARAVTPGAKSAAASSNVLRSDYAGSQPCKACHAKEHDAWARSPMHRMTRDANAEIHAPFDGSTLHLKNDAVTLETTNGRKYVRIARPGVKDELYRVTRVIGGRQREDFVGSRVVAANDPSANEEVVLPISYLLFSNSLRYKGYSVLVHERTFARSGPVWEETCIFCHNTVPFFSTIAGELAGARAPHYQGEDVDPLLPEERRWRWSVTNADALARAVKDDLAHLGATESHETKTRSLLEDDIYATRARFGADDFVEMGIGCEACHNGAKTHAANPANAALLPSLVPQAPFLAISPAPSKAQSVNRVCARCHQVLFSQYPFTWEGGKRRSTHPGGSTINSGEARDFLLGGCASALACTACHDPHDASERRARDDALATHAGNAVCTKCHEKYGQDDALRAHAHHDPRGAGGACVACHMARKNMGLDTRLTRYHRIGSPTDPERVLLDRPLECALCHERASVESLAAAMEKWWNKAYPRQELMRLYGDDLGARTLLATLDRGKPHEQATAAAILGEKHDREAAPRIARQLVNEYPLVRAFAARALDHALGKSCAIDVTTDAPRIEAAARACLASAGIRDGAWPSAAAPPAGSDDEVPED